HLDAAAGVAGLIKAVLALKHKFIPPSLHFKEPNKRINFENSPFYVNSTLRQWKRTNGPLRAGVSSFGIGGTNAHVVLEEAPQKKEVPADILRESRHYKLILLSAKTKSALDRATENLAKHLKENPDLDLSDAAYTLQVGRKAFKYGRMTVCATASEAIEVLSAAGTGNIYEYASQKEDKKVIFMFPGQGAQYVDMGLELYQKEPVFKEVVDRCFDILAPSMDEDLKKILYPGCDSPSHGPGAENAEVDRLIRGDINRTSITQPALFVFEYALARLLMKWGIRPHAMIGHSIGEYTAACLAGVFSLEDALALVALRGKLMDRMPPGAMLSVPLPEKELIPLLNADLELAAVNSPTNCVVSGPYNAVEIFENLLKEKGHECKRLHTSHAFHSKMMDPILKEFEEHIGKLTLNKPRIPYSSNVTGEAANADVQTPAYWAAQLRHTVRFADGVSRLPDIDNSIFIEVGPGKSLSTFVRRTGKKENPPTVINLVRRPKDRTTDHHYLLTNIGMLWLHGKKIDWNGFYGDEKRHRVPLPTYPFESKPYWIQGNPFTLNPRISSPMAAEKNTKNDDDKSINSHETFQKDEDTVTHAKRPDMVTPYVPPSDHIENTIAE
ncbi:MAG: type I polyketide synthase, partial [bacterium]|nr:type I polyketide synthase [bacterium]